MYPYEVHFRSFKRQCRSLIPVKAMDYKGFQKKKALPPCVCAYLRPIPIKKVSEDLSRDDLGLSGLTSLKCVRKSLIKSS